MRSAAIKIGDTIQPRCGCPTIHPEKVANCLILVCAGFMTDVPLSQIYECKTCGAAWEWGSPCAVARMPRDFAELLRMSDEDLRRAVVSEMSKPATEHKEGQ